MQRLLARYRGAIQALSARTKTPVPSLVASFLILHEVTAIVPFVATFFVAKSYDLGPTLMVETEKFLSSSKNDRGDETWFHKRLTHWTVEGQDWVLKVGRRYSIFGLQASDQADGPHPIPSKVAGDVANALAAYLITKALLPVRVAASLGLSPAFSRRILDPIRKYITRTKK